jgi:D-alanine-D-alanine ligase
MKKNIAIIAGGNSSEAVISFKSAKQVSAWLDPNLYQIYIIHLKGKEWILKSDLLSDIPVDKDDFSVTVNELKITFDCALIAIHGNPGEDGHLQAYFEMLDIPYTTCGLLASALTFNKYVCKVFLKQFGIETAKALLVKKTDKPDFAKIAEELKLPLFVKPNKNGSSFGVSKVNEVKELKAAFDLAFTEDDEVIVEEFIKGIEVTNGVLKTSLKEIVFPITEIVSENEYFDYEAKYQGKSKEITPARISAKVEEKCKELSSRIYDLIPCKGIVRIDYIIANDIPYLLEINTTPGMSEESIIPKQVKVAGLNMREVLGWVIEEACKKN